MDSDLHFTSGEVQSTISFHLQKNKCHDDLRGWTCTSVSWCPRLQGLGFDARPSQCRKSNVSTLGFGCLRYGHYFQISKHKIFKKNGIC